ncbi:hypothetical protein ACO0K2_19740, partial [Undibacterium sp. MH2W]|uniref:hypothetical protein n=1 Tax=Undibacterium sp. MH2W TaxID=3413044 RepID=UPI003BF03173
VYQRGGVDGAVDFVFAITIVADCHSHNVSLSDCFNVQHHFLSASFLHALLLRQWCYLALLLNYFLATLLMLPDNTTECRSAANART